MKTRALPVAMIADCTVWQQTQMAYTSVPSGNELVD